MGKIAIDESNRFGSDLKPLPPAHDPMNALRAKQLLFGGPNHYDQLHRLNLDRTVAQDLGTKSAEMVMRPRGRLFNMNHRTCQTSNPQRKQAPIFIDERQRIVG